jgi:hypothetical protein
MLDWKMITDGVFYENNIRKIKFFFERNRTGPLNLTINYLPIAYNQTNIQGNPELHEIVMDLHQFPFATNLSFLDTNQNYIIRINESIQNFSFTYEYNPFLEDGDSDGIVDGVEWELSDLYDITNESDGILDHDEDGLDIYQEYYEFSTDPLLPDTDGDMLDDGYEVEIGTNPLLSDTDGDSFSDGEEIMYGTNPNDPFDSLFTRNLIVCITVGTSITCIIILHKNKKPIGSWVKKVYRKLGKTDSLTHFDSPLVK